MYYFHSWINAGSFGEGPMLKQYMQAHALKEHDLYKGDFEQVEKDPKYYTVERAENDMFCYFDTAAFPKAPKAVLSTTQDFDQAIKAMCYTPSSIHTAI